MSIYNFDDDALMAKANESARETFKYFWRELYWEYRRIIPALDLACVKVAFPVDSPTDDMPSSEHMWINDIEYDGEHIYGTLINSPNWTTSVKEGDHVSAKMKDVGDWMYAYQGSVYGAFTVNLMRSRMSDEERLEHDEAWGFNFGDPNKIELERSDSDSQQRPSEKTVDPISEDELLAMDHPMSINMVESLNEQLKKSRELIEESDEAGYTLLHREALAGNLSIVKAIIEHGVDPQIRTNKGATAFDMAKICDWQHVMVYLGRLSK